MKLFSQNNISEIQKQMMVEQGMSRLDFIDVLGSDAACEIVAANPDKLPVVIFAGSDECGAIALNAASKLYADGVNHHVFLFNIGGNRLTDECNANLSRYKSISEGASITEVTGMRFSMPELDKGMLIVDGLFGSNITGPLSRGYQMLVTNINESCAKIIAIDSPSGLPGDPMSGLINSKIIHAAITLAITHPRLSFFINENIELVGSWKVIGPKPSSASLKRTPSSHYLIEGQNIKTRMPERMFNSSKNDYGSTIIYAGSFGMMGAAILATKSALRSGCGRVTCHSPRCGCEIMQISTPSAIFECDPDDKIIRDIELRRNYTSVAIGPGIGTDDMTINALESFLKTCFANRRQVVLDADALNCIAIRPTMLDYLPLLSIITPHANEFDRLFGHQPSSSARLAKAIEVAHRYKIIIILKGFYTATVRPDGKVFYNSSGTAALATAGTGDVLTGLIAGLLAQGFKPEIASIASVYIHGVAGHISENIHGTYGVTAQDVADNIGRAIKFIRE